jgi:uncharacterized protein (DUF2147 family)
MVIHPDAIAPQVVPTTRENGMKQAVRLCRILMLSLSMTSPCRADELAGTWLRENGEVRIRFEPCGDAICGIIVWLKPDSGSRAKVGQRVFYDLRPDGKNSWNGKAATNGSVYVGKVSLAGASLSTSGCIISGILCKSANWRRGP